MQRLCAFGAHAKGGEQHIDLAGLQTRDPVLVGYHLKLHRDAEEFPEQRGDIDVEAIILAGRVEEAEVLPTRRRER